MCVGKCKCAWEKSGFKFTRVRDVKPPVRGTEEAAGIDFFIPNDNPLIILNPGERILIKSGVHVKFDKGWGLFANDKSGVALKKGLTYLGGVIDSDYMGEIGFILINPTDRNIIIEAGEKIIQFVLFPVSLAQCEEVSTLEELYPVQSERGDKGFGEGTGNA